MPPTACCTLWMPLRNRREILMCSLTSLSGSKAPDSREPSSAEWMCNPELKPSELLNFGLNSGPKTLWANHPNRFVTNWHFEGQLLNLLFVLSPLNIQKNSASMEIPRRNKFQTGLDNKMNLDSVLQFIHLVLITGCNVFSKKDYVELLIPRLGKRVFSQIIKLKWGHRSGPYSNMTGVFMTKGNLDREGRQCGETQGGHLAKTEDWKDASTSHGKPKTAGRPPETRKRQGGVAYSFLRGSTALPALWFLTNSLQNFESINFSFLSHLVCDLTEKGHRCFSSRWKLYNRVFMFHKLIHRQTWGNAYGGFGGVAVLEYCIPNESKIDWVFWGGLSLSCARHMHVLAPCPVVTGPSPCQAAAGPHQPSPWVLLPRRRGLPLSLASWHLLPTSSRCVF